MIGKTLDAVAGVERVSETAERTHALEMKLT